MDEHLSGSMAWEGLRSSGEGLGIWYQWYRERPVGGAVYLVPRCWFQVLPGHPSDWLECNSAATYDRQSIQDNTSVKHLGGIYNVTGQEIFMSWCLTLARKPSLMSGLILFTGLTYTCIAERKQPAAQYSQHTLLQSSNSYTTTSRLQSWPGRLGRQHIKERSGFVW